MSEDERLTFFPIFIGMGVLNVRPVGWFIKPSVCGQLIGEPFRLIALRF